MSFSHGLHPTKQPYNPKQTQFQKFKKEKQKTQTKEKKNYLSWDSCTNCKDEAAKIPRKSGRQNGKGIISTTFGYISQESKEEHVDNIENRFDNLTTGFMTQIQNLVNKDLNQRP